MSLFLFIAALVIVFWTLYGALRVFSAGYHVDLGEESRPEAARSVLRGYVIIFGVLLSIFVLILLGKAGGVIFVASLVAALVAFIVKLIKITRS